MEKPKTIPDVKTVICFANFLMSGLVMMMGFWWRERARKLLPGQPATSSKLCLRLAIHCRPSPAGISGSIYRPLFLGDSINALHYFERFVGVRAFRAGNVRELVRLILDPIERSHIGRTSNRSLVRIPQSVFFCRLWLK